MLYLTDFVFSLSHHRGKCLTQKTASNGPLRSPAVLTRSLRSQELVFFVPNCLKGKSKHWTTFLSCDQTSEFYLSSFNLGLTLYDQTEMMVNAKVSVELL